MIREKILKNRKDILAVVIIFIIMFCTALLDNDQYMITFQYASKNLSGEKATLYYDYGEGFTEENSCYSEITSDRVSFPLKKVRKLRGIRFLPIRMEGKQENIISADIKIGCFTIKELSTKELIDNLTENSDVTVGKDYILAKKTEAAIYEQMEYTNMLFKCENGSFFLFLWLVIKIIFVILPLLLGIIMYMIGLYYTQKTHKFYSPVAGSVLLSLGILILYVTRNFIGIITGNILICILLGLLGMIGIPVKAEKNIRSEIMFSILLVYTYKTSYLTDKCGINLYGYLLQQIVLVITIIGMSTIDENRNFRNHDNSHYHKVDCNQITNLYVKVIMVYVLFGLLKNIMINGKWDVAEALSGCVTDISHINITWMFSLILFLYYMIGYGITNVMFTGMALILLIGNYIKIGYHNTLLTPMDFLQFADMFRIFGAMLEKWKIITIIAGTLVLVFMFVKNYKRILEYLKPQMNLILGIGSFLIVAKFTGNLLNNDYLNEFNIGYKWYVSEFVGEQTSGTYLYNMFNIVYAGDNLVSKPEGYSEDLMKNLNREFKQYVNSQVTDVKPNIICIMAESLFDIENINTLSFNEPIEPTVHDLMKSTLISPRFGGYTAAVEYEALTGHSLYFYKDGTMPYTTYYLNNKVNSVASEFKKNGYSTIAFHPNGGYFYSRERAYGMMDFDKMYTIADVVENDETLNEAGFYKDIPFAEKIIELLEEQSDPAFVFGVSIAAHYTADDHYKDNPMKVSGENLTQEEKHELEQMARSYQDSDQMIKMLVEYVDQCKTPTILYVFGDHLPPLSMYDKLDYIDDSINKFGTVLIGYGNYKTIDFPEYMTPNQLGPQMLIDAEVKHSSYWDYIYSLREKYPVIQKNFITQDAAVDLEYYRVIQYDLIFGKSWLVEN